MRTIARLLRRTFSFNRPRLVDLIINAEINKQFAVQ